MVQAVVEQEYLNGHDGMNVDGFISIFLGALGGLGGKKILNWI